MAKATAMANAALLAAKKALNIHSPSKAFEDLGQFGVQGLANAFDKGHNDIYQSSYSMSTQSIYGLQDALSKMADVIDNGVDNELTIRPVLDLSLVSAGMNKMNSMFDTSPSVGVLSRVNSISSTMSKNQNGGNNEISTAIKDLKKSFDNAPRQTIQIGDVTYDSDSSISKAVEELIRAIKVEGRI